MLVLMHARAHAHAPARWWVVAVVAADPEKATQRKANRSEARSS
jgi:hypothetical protein